MLFIPLLLQSFSFLLLLHRAHKHHPAIILCLILYHPTMVGLLFVRDQRRVHILLRSSHAHPRFLASLLSVIEETYSGLPDTQ